MRDDPTKTGDRRRVALDPDTVALLEPLRAKRKPYAPWLFSDTDEMPCPDRIGYWWRRCRELAGIDGAWRLHDLRHWSATFALSEGYDLATVAGRLGHSDPSTTLRLILAGAYSIGLLAVSAANRPRYPTEGIDRVEVSWVPLGYACRRVNRFDENHNTSPGVERVEGPGPITASVQLFLLAFPVTAWLVAGRMDEPVRRRRDLAEAWMVGGVGLAAVGVTAFVPGPAGLAAVLLVVGCPVGVFGVIYRQRTKASAQGESRSGTGARAQLS